MTAPLLEMQTFDVRHVGAVATVRHAAAELAQQMGFDRRACEEIALAATELASNLVKYAQSGRIVIKPLAREGRRGLELESSDQGPGIPDVEQALTDGFSTSGSLGFGLGSVNRLMDEFDIRSVLGKGTQVVGRKWVPNVIPSGQACPLQIGFASRPMRIGQPNGDAVVLKQWGGFVLVGVIDGLGHGPFAHRASMAARGYVETHYDRPLKDIFCGTGRTCRATRGVVMGLARFDWIQGRMAYASVGNVEARVVNATGYSFMVRRGIVGVNAPDPAVTELEWNPENILVLYSDGLHSHWGWNDFPELHDLPPLEVAQGLLKRLARENDDATMVVVRKADA